MDAGTRQAFLAQKLITFTEAVFWLAHGMERRFAMNFGTAEAAGSPWSDDIFETIVSEWREILTKAGTDPGRVAAIAIGSLPLQALLTQSQKSEVFLNFLIYLAKTGGAAVPAGQIADPDLSRQYEHLRGQDFSVTGRFANLLKAARGTFLHIGANDGNSPDDQAFHSLYSNRDWTKVLVEPNPHAAATLGRFVRDMPNIRIIEAAISDATEEKQMTMYKRSRLSSLSPEHTVPIQESDPGEDVPVQCLDGPSLFRTAALSEVDVLVCDTEGHDRIVLEQVFRCTRPRGICVEFANLALADRIAVIEDLEASGYRWCWAPLSLDIVAVRDQARAA